MESKWEHQRNVIGQESMIIEPGRCHGLRTHGHTKTSSSVSTVLIMMSATTKARKRHLFSRVSWVHFQNEHRVLSERACASCNLGKLNPAATPNPSFLVPDLLHSRLERTFQQAGGHDCARLHVPSPTWAAGATSFVPAGTPAPLSPLCVW